MNASVKAPIIDPRNTFGYKLKSSFFWKLFVTVFSPVFEFFWAWGLHFRDKVLFLFSPFNVACSKALVSQAAEVIHNNPDFIQFAKWLRGRIGDDVLSRCRQQMNSDSSEGSFSMPIENFLDEETRFEILRFATSDKILKRVLPYFKIIPRLDTAFVMFNIPRPSLGSPAGSQLWHRDADIYKLLNFYICITDLDENNGMYSAVTGRTLKYHRAIPQESIDPNISLWRNGRLNDLYLKKYVSPDEIINLKGPSGTAAFIDGAICYHKGGHCGSAERLLFQLNYIGDQTHKKESIIDGLKLRNHPRLAELLDTPVKRRLLAGNSGRRGTLTYALARRLLTRYASPLTS